MITLRTTYLSRRKLSAHNMDKPIEIVLKPTLQCNGSCSYCNVAERPSRMDVSTVEQTFRKVADYTNSIPGSTVTFLWHGGEPMLMGDAFFAKVLDLHQTFLGDWAAHLMQSNLTLANEALLDVLSELLNGGGLGTSLDPFEDYRRLKNGQSYPERWYEGFELAKRRGSSVGMVYVAHGGSVGMGRKIYHYFKNLGMDSLTLVPLEEPAGVFAGPRPDSREWGIFLLEMYRTWKDDDEALPIVPFVQWFGPGSDQVRPVSAELLNCCEPTLAVSPQGDVYPCVRLLDVGIGRIGNILTDSLESILAHPDAWWRSRRRDLIRQNECGSCRWWGFCAGGCAAASGTCAKTVWCEGYKTFFEAIHD